MLPSDKQETGESSTRLKDTAARCNASVTLKHASTFSGKSLEQDVSRLLRTGDVKNHREVLDKPVASSALAGAFHDWSGISVHMLVMFLAIPTRQCVACCGGKQDGEAYH